MQEHQNIEKNIPFCIIIRITSYIDESGDYTQIIPFHKLSFTSRLCVAGAGRGGGGLTGGCLPDPDLASLLMRICLLKSVSIFPGLSRLKLDVAEL